MGNILEIKNLVCGYVEKEIIKQVSFSAKEGEFLGIIGPNGSGKTTLLRSITGLLKYWEGEVLYNGRNISKIPLREFAQNVAVLPQILNINFSFTVQQLVLMGRYPYLKKFQSISKKDLDIAKNSMSLTDISHLTERRVGELSGGEWQRVLIAQALTQEPKLLLLDEPTTHLDITHQIETLDLVKKLNEEKGLTIVVVLHDLNLASEYCEKIIMLENGEIYREGTPEEVLTYKNIEEVYKTIVVVIE
ncbi:MAG: heme ABC transporter ATP-binding protein, partial [Elusimicrobia bacterium CG02_land_8_20_14_3_00_37_13]